MRITKEPEERKQEILETAMKLFYEKGYEKTSITDIANAIGVAQGLCYRYFPSKEILFDTAIDQYAQQLVSSLSSVEYAKGKTLKDIILTMPVLIENADSDSPYHGVLHQKENQKFHDQLAMKICEKLIPLVSRILQTAKVKGEIELTDIEAAASFCVYGQLGILLNHDEDANSKEQRIRDFLVYTLRL